jgi:FAD/FMN-containing dehydrogenase
VRDVDPLGNTMVAEAGCVLADLQQTAERHDRLYGVTLGAQGSCQIGGNISTNAGGTGVLKYGSTREQVIGLEVVLPDGRIWNGLRALRKDNAGYALKHLFVGAEGTLGIVTAATLRLHPRPVVWAAAWLTLDNVDDALRCLAMLQSIAGERVNAYELLNRAQLETVIEQFPDYRLPTDPQAPYAVLVELADTYAKADLPQLLETALGEFADKGWIRDAAIAANLAQLDSFWKIRHGISEANRKAGMGLGTDVAVPVRAVPEFIERASAAVLAQYPELDIVLVSHLGDGNVHFIPRMSFAQWKAQPDPFATADAVRAIVHDVAADMDGTFSAEHGIGHVLVDELQRLRSPLELELMHRIRDAIDPAHALNPGKVLAG